MSETILQDIVKNYRDGDITPLPPLKEGDITPLASLKEGNCQVEFKYGSKINIKELDYKLVKPLIWWE